MASVLQATGETIRHQPVIETDDTIKPNPRFVELKSRFGAAFANPPREPEGEFAPSVKAALFLANDGRVLELMKPASGNLAEQLTKENDAAKLAQTMYVAVLSRTPSGDEVQSVADFISANTEHRERAISHLIWALISSSEFCLNH